jgi:hyperosmotically inducible protein
VKTTTTYLLPKKKDDPCGTKVNLSITANVKGKLIKDTDIWSTNVDVKTVQCNVVLVGLVGSEDEKQKAVSHAKSEKRVRSVKSFLKSVQ